MKEFFGNLFTKVGIFFSQHWNEFVLRLHSLWKAVVKNLPFVLTFLGIVVALFLIAFLLEKIAQKKNGVKEKVFTTRKMAMVGMFSALATILMLIEIPLFFAPSFYKLDFSELPILIGTFAFGPAAGVMMEFIKIVLKLLVKGTSTAFVGELANFAVGSSFVLTASVIYNFKRTKKGAFAACIVGTIVLTIFGTAFNAIYLLPTFAKMYGMPLEDLLAMGSAVNPLCKEGSLLSFVSVCVAPLNLIKGLANSIIVLLVYKPLSPVLKGELKRSKSKKVVSENA